MAGDSTRFNPLSTHFPRDTDRVTLFGFRMLRWHLQRHPVTPWKNGGTSQALSVEPGNTRALFRRGCAYANVLQLRGRWETTSSLSIQGVVENGNPQDMVILMEKIMII